MPRDNYPNKIITHTSASSIETTAQDIDRYHKQRWVGFTSQIYKNNAGNYYHVGYHYVIEWDGTLVQTRGMHEEGAHVKGQNTSSIGVCFVGNGDIHEPSPEQLATWRTLYGVIKLEYPNITTQDIHPHRKFSNKTCHGALLSDTYYADKLLMQDPTSTYKQLLTELLALYNRLYTILVNERIK